MQRTDHVSARESGPQLEPVAINEFDLSPPLPDQHSPPNFFPYSHSSSSVNRVQGDVNVPDGLNTPSPRRHSTRPLNQPHGPTTRSTNPSGPTSTALLHALPPRHRADELLALYWRLNGTMYAFLDYDEIQSLYHRLWEGDDLGIQGPVFVCLLNVLFSLACTCDPSIPPSQRANVAEKYSQAARSSLNSQLTEHTSILTVQYFLLSALYLEATNDSHQCWNFVGLAIRVAQDLRLDSPSTSSDAPSEHRRNVIRKVWHACVFMDRAVSLTFSRHTMISPPAASAVPRPLPHPQGSVCHCYGASASTTPRDTSPHFFIEVLKLYEILDETLTTPWGSTSSKKLDQDAGYRELFGPQGAQTAGRLLQIHNKLNSWTQQLPTHLRQESWHRSGSTDHDRENLLLRLRYLHVRISVFRPVLTAFCSKQQDAKIAPEDALPASLGFQCAILCVRAALESIQLLDSSTLDISLQDLHEILPVAGCILTWIHRSATVLADGLRQESIVAAVTPSAIEDARSAIMKMWDRFQVFDTDTHRITSDLPSFYHSMLTQSRHLGSQSTHQRPDRVDPSPDWFRGSTDAFSDLRELTSFPDDCPPRYSMNVFNHVTGAAGPVAGTAHVPGDMSGLLSLPS